MSQEVEVRLGPCIGFMDAMPADDVPVNALTGDSLDWLVSRGRMSRRRGCAIYGDATTEQAAPEGHEQYIAREVAGVLESHWTARARRIVAAVLRSNESASPVPMMLYTNEGIKRACLAWRSTNGDGAWRQVAREYSNFHAPGGSSVPNHRVVPLVYENSLGGVTFHRLTREADRASLAGGSRTFLQAGDDVCTPGLTSCPVRWNGRWNDSADAGTEPYEVFPLGMIPPLAMATVTAGQDLGTTPGPFRGTHAFFYSMCFENERGELSMFTIPRAPGSAWTGYSGYGYKQMDSANPSHYFASRVFSNLPEGPPGTRWKVLLVSPLVDVASTGAGSIVTPSADDLRVLARVPQGVTTYVDTDGNDAALDADPRITDMISRGLQWPPCARDIGRFDGHVTLGCLRPNPFGLIVAPWEDGQLNYAIDDPRLYTAEVSFASGGSTVTASCTYGVAVTPTHLQLMRYHGGNVDRQDIALAGLTLRDLVDRINANANETTVTFANCEVIAFGFFPNLIKLNAVPTGVNVGDEIISPKFPAGTRVQSVDAGSQSVFATHPAIGGHATGLSITFKHQASGTAHVWAAQVTPGADASASADSLLRTRILSTFHHTQDSDVLLFGPADSAQHIVPGMLVHAPGYLPSWPDEGDPNVVSIEGGTARISALAFTTGTHEMLFYHDTGDNYTFPPSQIGFVRSYGNAFPVCLPWSQEYLEQFRTREEDTIFSGGSPGYPHDAVNTYFRANRRSVTTDFGPLVALADMGPFELHLHARGRKRLVNRRTGETRNDEDYALETASYVRGARSPYAVCVGSGWCVFASDDGIYATGGAFADDVCLSPGLYDRSRPPGSRGQLEYAIEASVQTMDAGTDEFRIHMDVIGSTLRVRYWTDETAGYPNREIRYDFSEGTDRAGLRELLRPDGRPYAWSTPLQVYASCACEMADADGVHVYGAVDSNSGTCDGRVDRLDTGNDDNGSPITPVGYSGTHVPRGFARIQPLRVAALMRKATEFTHSEDPPHILNHADSGVYVGFATDPRLVHYDTAPSVSEVQMEPSVHGGFGRSLKLFSGPARASVLDALVVRIRDDGTYDPPDIGELTVYAKLYEPTYSRGAHA